MDGLIRQLNKDPSGGMVSIFVDDVLAIARSVEDLQDVVDSCVNWPTIVQIEWTVSKCCRIKLRTPMTLNGMEISSQDHATYLDVYLGARGVTENGML